MALVQPLGEGPRGGRGLPGRGCTRIWGVASQPHQTQLLTWAQGLPGMAGSRPLRLLMPQWARVPVTHRGREGAEVPLHGWDVTPHGHSVPDGSATDILDGHGLRLRVQTAARIRATWTVASAPRSAHGLSHRGNRVWPSEYSHSSLPRPTTCPSPRCFHVTPFSV